MRTLKVKNIGPVKEAFLDLRKVNILIGPQSIGKSTLAKLVCNATWIEKEICLNMSADKFKDSEYFEENLVIYHKMEGFLTDESYIEFHSNVLTFTYYNKEFKFQWKNLSEYKRIKTLYIPAERNIVAVITNWFEVNLGRNNTRSYLADWERVRKYYTEKQPLKLLDIADYHYDNAARTDLFSSGNSKFTMQSASSGLQAVTPLLALLNFYSSMYYKNDEWQKEDNIEVLERMQSQFSLFQSRYLKTKQENNLGDSVWNAVYEYAKEQNRKTTPEIFDSEIDEKAMLGAFISFYRQLLAPEFTAFFIEEPEQNLYPTAQRDLINHLIESLSGRDHTVFITTHSPYVLTTINNMLLAYESAQTNHDATEAIVPHNRWLSKSEISAWKMDNTQGTLIPLLDEELAMLRAEDIDDVSAVINQEFDALFDLQTDQENGEE